MYQLFHIGIPKSGTTSVQKTLNNDPRIHVSRSRFFTGKEWWSSQRPELPSDKIIVESNETLVSGGFQKVKFEQVVSRLYQTNPNAQVVLTIRRQEDALVSMYKYHIKHNFEGTASFDQWLYDTNLGMDYISCCMYGTLVKSLLAFFPKEQVHVLFFESLRDNPNQFYEDFYKQLGVPFQAEYSASEKMNVMSFGDNALYTLNKLNFLSSSKKNSEGFKTSNPLKGLGQKVKRKVAGNLKFKVPSAFFELEATHNYGALMEEFKASNQMLIDLNFVTADQLKGYGYPL